MKSFIILLYQKEDVILMNNKNTNIVPINEDLSVAEYEKENYGGRRYLPYAFTERGIAILSGMLKNEIAVKVSINIMNAFVEMRKFISINGQVFQEINGIKKQLLEHDRKELYHCGASLKDLGEKMFCHK